MTDYATSINVSRMIKCIIPALLLLLALGLGGAAALATKDAGVSCAGEQFSDVCPGDWFYAPVTALAGLNAISGYSDGTFRPNNPVTRGQMLKVVVVAAGLSANLPETPTFTDVPLSQSFFQWVEVGVANGVVDGYPCGGAGEPCDAEGRPYFRPNANIVRGQVAKIVCNAFGWSPYVPTAPLFTDVPPSSPYYAYVGRVAVEGIIAGYLCGGLAEACDAEGRPYFRPFGSSTRAQTSKMVDGARTHGTPLPTLTGTPPTSTVTRTPVRPPATPTTALPPGLPCALFPPDNIWNRNVRALPIHPKSSAYMNSIGTGSVLHPDFGSRLWQGEPIGGPYIIVPGTQARVPVSFRYFQDSDPGPYPIPTNAPIQGGPQSTGDRHVMVLERDTCTLYEMFSAYPQADGSWGAGSGARWSLRSNALRPNGWTSADAAGLPILPGLVRYEEVERGEIRHAIRFTTLRANLGASWVWPARHSDGASTDPNDPPMGTRLRLKGSFDVSGYHPTLQVILRALQEYGMILADSGDPLNISGTPDARWDDDVLHALETVHASDFEVVDQSGLMIDPNSGQSR